MRKLNVMDGQTDGQTDGRTDRQTDGGRCNISRPGPSVPREIKTHEHLNNEIYIYCIHPASFVILVINIHMHICSYKNV